MAESWDICGLGHSKLAAAQARKPLQGMRTLIFYQRLSHIQPCFQPRVMHFADEFLGVWR